MAPSAALASSPPDRMKGSSGSMRVDRPGRTGGANGVFGSHGSDPIGLAGPFAAACHRGRQADRPGLQAAAGLDRLLRGGTFAGDPRAYAGAPTQRHPSTVIDGGSCSARETRKQVLHRQMIFGPASRAADPTGCSKQPPAARLVPMTRKRPHASGRRAGVICTGGRAAGLARRGVGTLPRGPADRYRRHPDARSSHTTTATLAASGAGSCGSGSNHNEMGSLMHYIQTKVTTWVLALAAGMVGATASAQPHALVGTPSSAEAFEARNIYLLDDISATALLYGVNDMRSMHGADKNLLEDYMRTFQFADTAAKQRLLKARERCADVTETFARKDCLQSLVAEFEGYGRKVAKAAFLGVPGRVAVSNWDEGRKQIVSAPIQFSFGSMTNNWCEKASICLNVGPYGNGSNMLCYAVEGADPSLRSMSFPLSEQEARSLSQRIGGIGELRNVTLLYEVLQPAKLRDGYRMCTLPGATRNKIMAEGKVRASLAVLWGPTQLEIVKSLVPDAGMPNRATASGSPAVAKVPMITAPAPAAAKPTGGKVLLDVK